jgi:hypothetical protein
MPLHSAAPLWLPFCLTVRDKIVGRKDERKGASIALCSTGPLRLVARIQERDRRRLVRRLKSA